jgi:hypothetical protein
MIAGLHIAANVTETGRRQGSMATTTSRAKASGVLSYDPSSNAAGGATAFALLTNHAVLAANDFQVI